MIGFEPKYLSMDLQDEPKVHLPPKCPYVLVMRVNTT